MVDAFILLVLVLSANLTSGGHDTCFVFRFSDLFPSASSCRTCRIQYDGIAYVSSTTALHRIAYSAYCITLYQVGCIISVVVWSPHSRALYR